MDLRESPQEVTLVPPVHLNLDVGLTPPRVEARRSGREDHQGEEESVRSEGHHPLPATSSLGPFLHTHPPLFLSAPVQAFPRWVG